MTQMPDKELTAAPTVKDQLALDFGDFVYELVRFATSEEYGDARYFERRTAERKAIFSKFGLSLLSYFENLCVVGGNQHMEIVDGLADLRDSLDFLAASSNGIDLDAEPARHQQARHQQASCDYDWLKALVHKAYPELTEGESLAIHDRIARLARL